MAEMEEEVLSSGISLELLETSLSHLSLILTHSFTHEQNFPAISYLT